MTFRARHLLGIEPSRRTRSATLLDLADTYADLNRRADQAHPTRWPA